MVFCSIIGCGCRSPRDKYSFQHLLAVLKHQGTKMRAEMLELSSERCRAWVAAISRADLTEEKLPNVCGSHFVRGLLIILHDHAYYRILFRRTFINIINMSDVDWFPCLNLGQ